MNNPFRHLLWIWVTLLPAFVPIINAGGDWPGWGGPNGNLVVLEVEDFPADQKVRLEVSWKRELGSGYSSVSVVNGIAVTGFSNEESNLVAAFDAANGNELWRFRMGPVYNGHTGSHDGPIATPLIAEGMVFMLDTYGKLFALDVKSGSEIWSTDLPSDLGAYEPHYGFGTSPLRYGNMLLVQTGGSDGKSLSGFDMSTGNILWSTGSERIEQQSPIIWPVSSKDQFIAAANRSLWGVEPRSGKVLWQYDFEGTDVPTGSPTTTITPAGPNRFLFKNSTSGSRLIGLTSNGNHWSVEELWTTRHLKDNFVPSIYHEGYFFGYNTRTLSCVDGKTGNLVWRSRPPGDGFITLLDNHLVIITKQGKLSLAPATVDGYEELAGIQLFDDLVWAPASFAGNSLFLRSMSEIARVRMVRAEQPEVVEESVHGIIADSDFGRFIRELESADDQESRIEAYLKSQQQFPVIEGKELVHFIYKGPAEDLALSSPIIGARFDHPMNRVAGTDFHYYSVRLEPDARVSYQFKKNFEETLVDPLNETGYVTMPEFVEPDHLREPDPDRRGSIESLEFDSRVMGKRLKLDVYLPAGFSHERIYPVAYFNNGSSALKSARIDRSLDNLIGRTVEPVIVVLIPSFGTSAILTYQEYIGKFKKRYTRFLLEEIVPLVDRKFPVEKDPERRALIGRGASSLSSVYTVFKNPGLFHKLGLHSIWWNDGIVEEHRALMPGPHKQPLVIYYDWGSYAYRSPDEGSDGVASARNFARLLQEKGYHFSGGEFHQGSNWTDFMYRTGKLFEALFPIH